MACMHTSQHAFETDKSTTFGTLFSPAARLSENQEPSGTQRSQQRAQLAAPQDTVQRRQARTSQSAPETRAHPKGSFIFSRPPHSTHHPAGFHALHPAEVLRGQHILRALRNKKICHTTEHLKISRCMNAHPSRCTATPPENDPLLFQRVAALASTTS